MQFETSSHIKKYKLCLSEVLSFAFYCNTYLFTNMAAGRVWPVGRELEPLTWMGCESLLKAYQRCRWLCRNPNPPPPPPFPTNKIRKHCRLSRLLHRLAFVFGPVERLDCATAVLNMHVKSVIEIKYDSR
jgi:hypothetical protein